jgi:hypothetical protein
MIRVALILALLIGMTGCASAQPGRPDPAVVLLGQSWVGLWRDGKMVAMQEKPGWQFQAARLTGDGATVEITAYPVDRPDAPVTVFRFDTDRLAAGGRRAEAAAAQWPPLAAPLGTDLRVPDAARPEGPMRVATDVEGVRVTRAGATGGRRLPPGSWRIAMSPDGSTAAAFARPTAGDGAWPGTVWDIRTGRDIAAPGLGIDDGSARENGAARSLACLLPRGEGAILTYIGAPADRSSEYLPFGKAGATAVPLSTPYVVTCLAVP